MTNDERESSLATTISALTALVQEHSQPGWNGEGARPLSQVAAARAEAFVRALPDDLVKPELAAEPDGSISLDWIASRTGIVSVSVGETNRLAVAWLHGTDHGHTVLPFDGERIPALILEKVRTEHGLTLPTGS